MIVPVSAPAWKDASLWGCQMAFTGIDGVNQPCSWNRLGRNFFRTRESLSWKILAIKILMPDFFSLNYWGSPEV
jgi:hypothetical protein